MAQHILKTSMANGEITPLASQRQDLELYKKSVERLFNWFSLKHGGARRRSGTRYRGMTKFTNSAVKLIAYTFSIGQSYVLEFGQLYMRVWVTGGLVADGGGILPYELVTPYAATQVKALQVAPYNDNVFMAHSAVFPQRLTRVLTNDWDIANAEFRDGPYLPVNDIAANTVAVSGALTTGANITFTWSSGAVALSSVDVGRHVRVAYAGKWSWGTITSVTSALIAVVNIKDGQGGTGSSVSWRLGAFYIGNYPACVSFFEDRLIWSGVPASPRTIYSSYSGLPNTYSPTDKDGVVTDAHGFSLEIGRSDPILWLKETTRLQLGTASGIRSIGGTSGAALTAKNVTQKLEVKVGATAIVPEQTGQSTVFVGRTNRRLNNMYYDYQVNGLVAPELSILSEHLLKKGITDLAYQETPDSILWAPDMDGKLLAVTIEQSEDVRGFSSHDVSGFVSSVAVMQPEERDELWMAVTRTINGSTAQYIESLEKPYDQDITLPADAFFVDCGGSYSGAATNTVSGVTWLAGKTVELLADGARLPNVVVSVGGVITLPNSRTASKLQFGLPIPNKIVTLEAPATSSDSDGASLGRRKKAHSVIAKLLSSQGVRVAAKDGKKELFSYRNASALLGLALPLNTGTFKKQIDDTFEKQAQIELDVDGPFPATVLALNIDVESEP